MIPLNIGKIYRIIRTEDGLGLPAYKEWDKAPAGERWSWKLAEGAEITLTRHPRLGTSWVEGKTKLGYIVVFDGEGHLEEVAPPKPPVEQWDTIWEFTLFGVDVRVQKRV